jgi:hypothetical protein
VAQLVQGAGGERQEETRPFVSGARLVLEAVEPQFEVLGSVDAHAPGIAWKKYSMQGMSTAYRKPGRERRPMSA